MRGAAFFDGATFPQARYTATKFRALGGNRYAADGTLSLRGVSKPVTLAFTWTPGAKPVLPGKATVKRLDFGVGGGEWADTALLPNEIAGHARKVVFAAEALDQRHEGARPRSASNGQSSSASLSSSRSTGTRSP